MKLLRTIGALALIAAVLGGCQDDEDDDDGPFVVIPGAASGEVFGVTVDNTLISFNVSSPGQLSSAVGITGLAAGELVLGIDFRPSTGELYALTNRDRLYTVDLMTAQATVIGAGPFTPALAGADFGFDFNPVVDRLRVTSDTDQNLRLHPVTGAAVAADATLGFAAGDPNQPINPTIVAAAYTNAFPGSASTTLYAIDSGLDALVTIGSPQGSPSSPNDGVLFTVAEIRSEGLRVDTTAQVGFDVSAYGVALAALTPPQGTQSTLYSLDLATGAASVIGSIAATIVRDIAIRPPALPRVVGLSAANELVTFRPGAPSALLATVPVTGLGAGEVLVGIDYRPATAQLIGVGSSSVVYALDVQSGVATALGAPFNPPLAGSVFGVDFNPAVDRLRIVSDLDQNLRVNPVSGQVAGTDAPLAFDAAGPHPFANPQVVASAYRDNVAGVASTTLYGIDSGLDILVLQGSAGGTPVSPNAGTLFDVGALGIDAGDQAGFDVSPLGGALASLTPAGQSISRLYTIDLTTGATIAIGDIGGAQPIRDIAIEPPSVPLVWGVTGANRLVSFVAGAPGVLTRDMAISGLVAGESIVGLDFRPASRELIAVGSASRIYRLNLTTGAALRIGGAPFTPGLAGNAFGVDFDPRTDRLRVTSDLGQNLRLNVQSGTVAAIDTSLAFAGTTTTPTIVAAAYSSNAAGSPSTTLYGIDSNLDQLVTIGSPGGVPDAPQTGMVTPVGGALGVDTTDIAGLDIAIAGTAYLVVNAPATSGSSLYTVNLATGAAALVGTVGVSETLRDIAVQPPSF
jgi:trimeric autotransporter adhesin